MKPYIFRIEACSRETTMTSTLTPHGNPHEIVWHTQGWIGNWLLRMIFPCDCSEGNMKRLTPGGKRYRMGGQGVRRGEIHESGDLGDIFQWGSLDRQMRERALSRADRSARHFLGECPGET